jgi:hypothetical protein
MPGKHVFVLSGFKSHMINEIRWGTPPPLDRSKKSVYVLLLVFVIRFTFKPNHLSYLSYLCVILEVTKLRHLPESSSSSGLHSIDAYGR